MIAGLSKNRFNSVQLKDIVRRNRIRDGDLLERIISYVTANVGTTFSATALAGFLKNEQRTVAPETILNDIKYCCDAYLFYQVKREDLQGKQILASNENSIFANCRNKLSISVLEGCQSDLGWP